VIRYFYTIAHGAQMHRTARAGLLSDLFPLVFFNVGAVNVQIKVVITHGPTAPSVQALHNDVGRKRGRAPP
jgi:hypothetical protein